MIDLRQTTEYAKYIKNLKWKVFKIQMSKSKIQIFVKSIPLLGKIAKLQRPSVEISPAILTKFIDQHKISAFYFEPSTLNSQLSIPNFKLAKSAFLPTKTLQIDLTKTEQKLLAEMKQKTRYNINLAKKNVVIKKSQDIDLFISLWHKTSLTRGTWLPAKKEIKGIFDAFGKNCYLLLAHKSDVSYNDISNIKPIAGILVACSPDTAFYLYAASDSEGKKLFAPTLLAWEAIQNAKKRKLKIFDFDGIYDTRYPKQSKSWIGFTKFKEGFGGKIIEFPKILAHYKNPLIKLLI